MFEFRMIFDDEEILVCGNSLMDACERVGASPDEVKVISKKRK